ncbi:MAG: hypothetical protein GX968_07750 [Tissierellia bacterium]|nr:hypothetical protein [Tissierellia bacterium]
MEERITNCKKKMLEFIRDWESTKGIDILIGIYDEIRFSGKTKEDIGQKYLRILYNIKNSNNWDSILDEEDYLGLESFLEDLLQIRYDGEDYYIASDCYKELSLDEIYQILLEAKYLKEKEISNEKDTQRL